MNSAIYRGWVRHRRFLPVQNNFTYSVYMLYLDLDELDEVFRGRWLWSTHRPTVAWFRDRDYLPPNQHSSEPLRIRVERLVESHGYARPRGRIGLLTTLRCFGYCMNPVSFYYCLNDDGRHAETIIAEITNTPWNERHCYVLSRSCSEGAGRMHRHRFAKNFHISPFMPMKQQYDWRMSDPGERAVVHMDTMEEGRKIFDATMVLHRRPMTTANLTRCLLRHPVMSAEVVARIYWQAAKLRLKGAPFHAHPRHHKELAT